MTMDVNTAAGARIVTDEESSFIREKPHAARRVLGSTAARRTVLVLLMAAAWQSYSIWLDRPLLLPTFVQTLIALYQGIVHGPMLLRTATSLYLLGIGYVIGVAVAALLTVAAATTRIGHDLLELLCAMLNPLPAMALLPLALLWLGLGTSSMVLVLVHAVLWPVATNAFAGLNGVSPTLRLVGRNCGLSPLRLVCRVLIPAALPGILTGLRLGWAFAWRTLIASELVFGVSSGSGGLGWYIYENKNLLEIPSVFAGLLMVMLIGLVIEYGVFRTIENHTIRRWGMVRGAAGGMVQ